MKRLLTAAAALAAVFVLTHAVDAQDKLRFALVPKAMNNPFFDLARDGA